MSSTPDAGDPLTVREGEASVVLRKVFTRAGERLELRAPRRSAVVRLDAMELEGLSWADLGELLGSRDAPSEAVDRPVPAERGPEPIRIGNEFGLAHVREVGPAVVEIRSPRTGYANRLGARSLEAIAGRDAAFFSDLLSTPFGPDGHDH